MVRALGVLALLACMLSFDAKAGDYNAGMAECQVWVAQRQSQHLTCLDGNASAEYSFTCEYQGGQVIKGMGSCPFANNGESQWLESFFFEGPVQQQCDAGETISSGTGFVGAQPTGNVCREGCSYSYSEDGGGEVCVSAGDGSGQTCTHYGTYTGTGEACTGPDAAQPDPDGRTCTDLGGGYQICQKGEGGPPCIIGPNSTQCVYPPGPICSNFGGAGTICIGDENGGDPPSPPDLDDDDEPPPVCGIVNGQRVCHHPPDDDDDDDGTPDDEDDDADGDGQPDDDEPPPDTDDCPAGNPNCEDDDDEDDGEMAGDAPCGSEPPCEGDAVGCAQLGKQHKIACEVEHSNEVLANFRNKQLEEVRETNAKIAALQDKVTAEQKLTTDAIKAMTDEAHRDTSESNQRLANLNSKLSTELAATRDRINSIAPDMVGPGQKTLTDLDAKLAAEIAATNDMRDVLAAQYGDQEAILALIQSDTDAAKEKLTDIAAIVGSADDSLDEINQRAKSGSAPASCAGMISCAGDDAECERQRALFAAMCLAVERQQETTDAVEAAAGQITGAVNGIDVSVDTSGMESRQSQTNSLLGDALNKLDALNNLINTATNPGLAAIDSLLGGIDTKLAAFGQEGSGAETFTPNESEWGDEADPSDVLHDISDDVGLLDDAGFGWSRACPLPQTVTFQGNVLEFRTDLLCDWMEVGSALMLVVVSLFCLRILSVGVRF